MTVPSGLLRCVGCGKGMLVEGPEPATALRCDACASTYPVREGVVDLLGEGPSPSPAQRVMELRAVVRIYESRLWRRNPMLKLLLGLTFEEERDLVLRAAGLTGRETVLDLACGTGIYSRELARRVPRGLVVGLDLSAPMLEEATRRACAEGLANVLLVHADAGRLPFFPSRLDVVLCCGALHLFPDVRGVLGEIARVLRPNGRFVVAALRRPEGPVADLIIGARRRVLGLSAFTRRELERRLTEAGFGWIECHHDRSDWLILSGARTAAGGPREP
jgi:SAM-dependent methyltransferase